MRTKFPFYPEDRRQEIEDWVAEYTFDQTEPTPWVPLRRRLRHSRATVVTTAGVRLSTQTQFDVTRSSGSSEFRQITLYAKSSSLAFDFTNYDPTDAQQDINCLIPLDRMRELVDEGVLGGLTEYFFSFHGLCDDIDGLKKSAAVAAEKTLAEGADIAFIFSANLTCNQTGGIVAREMERRGVSTVFLATAREIPELVRVPRTVFVNFPFGRPLGRAKDRETQRRVLDEMVTALRKFQRPGRIRVSDLRWNGLVA